jgi:RNA polymerase sigma-70 factor (ECF subfamily)
MEPPCGGGIEKKDGRDFWPSWPEAEAFLHFAACENFHQKSCCTLVSHGSYIIERFFGRATPVTLPPLPSLRDLHKNGIIKVVVRGGGALMIPLIILAIENDSDRDFMIAIYTELHPVMKATAFQIVNDSKIAEDMVHDTIVHLIRNLDTIRGFERKRLVAYISKAVKNNSLHYYHRKRIEKDHTFYGFENGAVTTVPDDSASPMERLEISEEYENLGRALKRLPERERELLRLKYDMQYDDETIGKIMGIKKDSVRQYLTRARRLAKEYFLKR